MHVIVHCGFVLVPCQRRVTSLELNYQTERPVEGEDEWIAASSYAKSGVTNDVNGGT